MIGMTTVPGSALFGSHFARKYAQVDFTYPRGVSLELSKDVVNMPGSAGGVRTGVAVIVGVRVGVSVGVGCGVLVDVGTPCVAVSNALSNWAVWSGEFAVGTGCGAHDVRMSVKTQANKRND